MSVDGFRYRQRSGMLRCDNMVKWKFYPVVYEDFLAYFDDEDTNTHYLDLPTRSTSHKSLAVTRSFG